jgi:glycosyltransferase involved in cell wall biosynthesis
MKLALLGPIAWRTPPRHYGPWERVTGLLADGLAQRGVDVTLFATLDSITLARLDGVCERPYEEDEDLDGRVWEALHVAHALGRSSEFDLIHNHLDWLPLAFAGHAQAPMVTTIHGFSSPRILPAYRHSGSAFVSISDADRRPELDYVATVHHGVDTEALPFSATPGDGLVCFGRIHPDKGTAQAIEIARGAGRPLLLCGPVQDTRYFTEEIEPHIDGDRVCYLGSVGSTDRAAVLGAASCLLHPIAFAEPFGLSVVESMLCGTPVVAYDRGSMPELVEDGVTGVLAHDVDSAIASIDRAVEVDRAGCRRAAERRFSAGRMVADYIDVYESVLHDR